MKKIDFGQTIAILANLGVIAGIIFLVFELQQNNEMIRGQTRSQLAKDVIDLFQSNMSDDTYADLLVRGNSGEELSTVERYQYSRHRNAWIWNWENVVYQRSIGLYDQAEFATQIAIIRRDMDSNPGIKRHWCEGRRWYSEALVEAIEGEAQGEFC